MTNKKLSTKALCLTLIVSLSACATQYQSAPPSDNNATIVFKETENQNNGFGKARRLGFDVFREDNCKKGERAIAFETTTKKEVEYQVESGKVFTLLAGLVDYSPDRDPATGAIVSRLKACRKAAKFTPKPNQMYIIELNGNGSSCVLSIKNTKSDEGINGVSIWTPKSTDGSICK